MNEKTKILIADDHRLFLDGIVSLLQTEKQFVIARTVTNGAEVLDALGKEDIDLCILDINMPVMNGITTTRQMKKLFPSVKIIILTTYNDREFISELLLAGINGYVLKNATKAELIAAIRDVMKGKQYYSREVSDHLLHNYVDILKKEKEAEEVLLTRREKEIVKLLARELTNARIAEELHISFRTVETHRKNIMHKTGAQNLAGLIKYALAKGIIS